MRRTRGGAAWTLALVASVLLASGVGRALVFCHSGAHGAHLELLHSGGSCEHAADHDARPVCQGHRHHGQGHDRGHRHGHGGSRDTEAGVPLGERPDDCVDRPLWSDYGPAPAAADVELAPPLLLTVLSWELPQLRDLGPGRRATARDPPRPRPPTELRRTVQLLL